MNQEKEESNIKKMAQLLRDGATMLDLTCPQCENILFKLKTGRKYCPVCDREVFFEEEFKKIKHNQSSDVKNEQINLKSEREIVKNKITKICNLIDNNEQISMIKDLLEILEKLLNVYQKLSII